MKYFYDTEFLEDGSTIDLISIGIVCEDGREYYAVNSKCDFARIKKNDWMVRNVVTGLPVENVDDLIRYCDHSSTHVARPSIKYVELDKTDVNVKPKWVIANEVRNFLLSEAGNGSEKHLMPELWAYYSAYDHVALAQLWGPMIKLPAGIPMFTHDLMQLIEHADGRVIPPEPHEGAHNALVDARWNKACYELLTQ